MENTLNLKRDVENQVIELKRLLQSVEFDDDYFEDLEYSIEYIQFLVNKLPDEILKENMIDLQCQFALILEEIQDIITTKEKSTK